jgi:hypothetical protein
MSNYFQYFPRESYIFGDEAMPDIFQNITRYADVIDQVKDNSSLYEDYYIQDNERPDQVSYNLYGNANFYWTFYLMNNKIREQSWPLSNEKVLEYAQKYYPNKTLTTRDSLSTITGFYKTGDVVEGRSSGATGNIVHRNLDIGQITVKVTSGTFLSTENIQTDGTTEIVKLTAAEDEYNAAHHYEDSSNVWTDIDPTVGPGGLLTEVTVLDRLYNQNNDLRQIKIIKSGLIQDIVSSFREAIAN